MQMHMHRSQLPDFEYEALKEAFEEIDHKNLKPAGVTHELQQLHGSHSFLYSLIDLQNLHDQFKKKPLNSKYYKMKRKRQNLEESQSVTL
jgi:hypothetical protein